jgi:hypothetical protein
VELLLNDIPIGIGRRSIGAAVLGALSGCPGAHEFLRILIPGLTRCAHRWLTHLARHWRLGRRPSWTIMLGKVESNSKS